MPNTESNALECRKLCGGIISLKHAESKTGGVNPDQVKPETSNKNLSRANVCDSDELSKVMESGTEGITPNCAIP